VSFWQNLRLAALKMQDDDLQDSVNFNPALSSRRFAAREAPWDSLGLCYSAAHEQKCPKACRSPPPCCLSPTKHLKVSSNWSLVLQCPAYRLRVSQQRASRQHYHDHVRRSKCKRKRRWFAYVGLAQEDASVCNHNCRRRFLSQRHNEKEGTLTGVHT
jgi:hypothetical protein